MNNSIVLRSFRNELEKIGVGVNWSKLRKMPLEVVRRLHAKTPVAKTYSGEHVLTPITGKSSWQQRLDSNLSKNIKPEELKTTYMRGGKETNIAKRRKQLFEHLQSRTPSSKFKRVTKSVGVGLGAGAGILGAGTLYGGLTMEPDIASRNISEPAAAPISYGGTYY